MVSLYCLGKEVLTMVNSMTYFKKSTYVLAVSFLALHVGSALAATKVGVTSAVNPKAVATAPGGATRTLILGRNVVFNQHIKTSRGGLVQLLFVDGSAFTIGENSELVIDRFIYDPNKKTGKMVANVVKGVFRFVGGRLSKAPGGVTIKTPGATIGIRGGVMTGNVGRRGGKSTFSLLFGDLMSVGTSCAGAAVSSCSSIRRAYQNGNSIDVGAGGALGLRPTTLIDVATINRALAGTPGRRGGAKKSPSEKSVKKSKVGKSNSANSPDQNSPFDENAIRSTRFPDVETGLIGLGNVTGDDTRREFDEPEVTTTITTTPPPSNF